MTSIQAIWAIRQEHDWSLLILYKEKFEYKPVTLTASSNPEGPSQSLHPTTFPTRYQQGVANLDSCRSVIPSVGTGQHYPSVCEENFSLHTGLETGLQ